LENKRPATTAPGWGATIRRWRSPTLNNRGCSSYCARPAEEPVAFADLHVGGISFPAAVISELVS
jgi:hypothetical protein